LDILGIYFYGTYPSKKAKKNLNYELGLICVLKENYKYAQKQNLEVKQI
jgi:hypothetical protein